MKCLIFPKIYILKVTFTLCQMITTLKLLGYTRQAMVSNLTFMNIQKTAPKTGAKMQSWHCHGGVLGV